MLWVNALISSALTIGTGRLEPVLLNVFITDSAPSACLQMTPSQVVWGHAWGMGPIQRDLDKMGKWVRVTLMRFS